MVVHGCFASSSIARSILASAALALIFFSVQGCSSAIRPTKAISGESEDVLKRVAEIARISGFGDFLRTHGGNRGQVLSIEVSLDSLTGRHLSLEKLLTDIGRICVHPAFGHLQIQIDVVAEDEEDQMYLYALLSAAVNNRSNVAVLTTADRTGVAMIRLQSTLSNRQDPKRRER